MGFLVSVPSIFTIFLHRSKCPFLVIMVATKYIQLMLGFFWWIFTITYNQTADPASWLFPKTWQTCFYTEGTRGTISSQFGSIRFGLRSRWIGRASLHRSWWEAGENNLQVTGQMPDYLSLQTSKSLSDWVTGSLPIQKSQDCWRSHQIAAAGHGIIITF